MTVRDLDVLINNSNADVMFFETQTLLEQLNNIILDKEKLLTDIDKVSETFTNQIDEFLISLTSLDKGHEKINEELKNATESEDFEQLLQKKLNLQDCYKNLNVEDLQFVKDTADSLKRFLPEKLHFQVEEQISELEETLQERLTDLTDSLSDLQDIGWLSKRFDSKQQHIVAHLANLNSAFKQLNDNAKYISLDDQLLKIKKLMNESGSLDYDFENLRFECDDLLKLTLRSNASMSSKWETGLEELEQEHLSLKHELDKYEKNVRDQKLKLGEVRSLLMNIKEDLEDKSLKLQTLDNVFGDISFLEGCLKDLKKLKNSLRFAKKHLKNIEKEITKNPQLNASVELKEEVLDTQNLLSDVTFQANEVLTTVSEILSNITAIFQDVKDSIKYLDCLKDSLKDQKLKLGITNTNKSELKIKKDLQDFDAEDKKIEKLVQQAEDFISKCKPENIHHLERYLNALKRKWNLMKQRIFRLKKQLNKHKKLVKDYEKEQKVLLKWVIEAEVKTQRYPKPSKITKTCKQQVEDHNKNIFEANEQKNRLSDFCNLATRVKYHGNATDTVQIGQQLSELQLRYKKVLTRALERQRILEQQYREDKQFSDSHEELLDWIKKTQSVLQKLNLEISHTMFSKEHASKLSKLSTDLSYKHPSYQMCHRLGKNLISRCVKGDKERDVLIEMLSQLKSLWVKLRDAVENEKMRALEKKSKNGNKLNLNGWLDKNLEATKPDRNFLGDKKFVVKSQQEIEKIDEEMHEYNPILEYRKELKSGEETESLIQKMDLLKNQLLKSHEKLENSLQISMQFEDLFEMVQNLLKSGEKVLTKLTERSPKKDKTSLVENLNEVLLNLDPLYQNLVEIGTKIIKEGHSICKKTVQNSLIDVRRRYDLLSKTYKAKHEELISKQDFLARLESQTAEMELQLNELEAELNLQQQEPLSEDLSIAEQHLAAHKIIHDQLSDLGTYLTKIQDKFKKNPASTNLKSTENEILRKLQLKYRHLFKESLLRKEKLQNHLQKLIEANSVKDFNFDKWKESYLSWLKTRNFRLTEQFQKTDQDGTGVLSKENFLQGISKSRYPTTPAELAKVFSIFDTNGTGFINYYDFLKTLKLGEKVRKDPITESEIIHDEVSKETALCTCALQFYVCKIGDGKYRFGDQKKMYLLRFLNSSVMVRIGGGWQTLVEFLRKHDPCRVAAHSFSRNSSARQSISSSSLPKSVPTSPLKRTGSNSSIDSQKSSNLSLRSSWK